MIVTVQMLVNLIVVGAGIRVVVSAARRGMAQKGAYVPPVDDFTGDPT